MAGTARMAHSKSRNGCKQCKKRRMKCSEQKPRCIECARRGESCEYPWSASTANDTPSMPGAGAGVTNPSAGQELLASPFSATSSVLSGDWDTREFLFAMPGMSPTLTPAESDIWFTTFSSQLTASSHLYLTRNALAIAALQHHYSESEHAAAAADSSKTAVNPFEGFLLQACDHHNVASEVFRSSTRNINGRNWLATFIFTVSTLVFNFHVFGRDRVPEMFGQQGFFQVFLLLRQSAELGRDMMPWFRQGPMWQVIRQGLIGGQIGSPKGQDDDGPGSLEQAMRAVTILDDVVDMDGTSSLEERGIYHAMIKALREWLYTNSGTPRSWIDLTSWPYQASPEYIALVQARAPMALVIYTYWCAIMNQAPERWYLDGWAARTIAAAAESLGSEWDSVLDWPRRVVGLQTYPSIMPQTSGTHDGWFQLQAQTG